MSEEAGGFGGSEVENAILAEELGRGLVVEPFLAAILALQVLARIGEFDGRAALIEGVIAGERKIVLAHGEADGRGDPRIIAATATPRGEGWAISGSKSMIMGAPSADALLVSARTPGGVSLFLVEPGSPGLDCHEYRLVDNARVADIRLEAVEGRLIGQEGGALDAIEAALDHATIVACAEAVGLMDTALFMTRDYLKTRKQFGVAIGDFQALQHRMADMLVEMELARSMVFQGLAALAQGDADARREGVSAAKAIVNDAGLFVTRQAIQLHGGIGMTEEYAVGHYYRRMFVINQLFGNSDVHLVRYADLAFPA